MGLTKNGWDMVAKGVGGDAVAITGTATATSATSLTTSAVFTASVAGPPDSGGHVGHIVVAGAASPFAYGVILSNSTTVLTIDYWHPIPVTETPASTPSGTTPFCILPGTHPAFYMGVTANATAFTNTDTTLTAEIWTSGGGIRRRLASWAHTTALATYTIANTFTVNGSDTGLPITVAKVGIFQHYVNAAVTTSNSGIMLFETVLSSSAVLSAIGDNVAITDTVTIS